jgi:putative transposase
VSYEFDNAMCESSFVTLECELLDNPKLGCHSEDKIGVFIFIEGWYIPPTPALGT